MASVELLFAKLTSREMKTNHPQSQVPFQNEEYNDNLPRNAMIHDRLADFKDLMLQ